MSDKPSYLGLLNYLTQNECEAHAYLTAWAAGDTVGRRPRRAAEGRGPRGRARHELPQAHRRARLSAAARATPTVEKAIAHRQVRQVRPREDRDLRAAEARHAATGPTCSTTSSTTTRSTSATGGLLGRYIAEERDTARLLRSCYEQLQAADTEAPRRAAQQGAEGARQEGRRPVPRRRRAAPDRGRPGDARRHQVGPPTSSPTSAGATTAADGRRCAGRTRPCTA